LNAFSFLMTQRPLVWTNSRCSHPVFDFNPRHIRSLLLFLLRLPLKMWKTPWDGAVLQKQPFCFFFAPLGWLGGPFRLSVGSHASLSTAGFFFFPSPPDLCASRGIRDQDSFLRFPPCLEPKGCEALVMASIHPCPAFCRPYSPPYFSLSDFPDPRSLPSSHTRRGAPFFFWHGRAVYEEIPVLLSFKERKCHCFLEAYTPSKPVLPPPLRSSAGRVGFYKRVSGGLQRIPS